jgi:hypothetical protein
LLEGVSREALAASSGLNKSLNKELCVLSYLHPFGRCHNPAYGALDPGGESATKVEKLKNWNTLNYYA